jgi:hypothetical protein
VTGKHAFISKLGPLRVGPRVVNAARTLPSQLAGFLNAQFASQHQRTDLQTILALGVLALLGGAPSGIDGSYLAHTMNGHVLPAELRVPVTAGNFRLFRLEQCVLRLSDDGQFTLHFRYYHQLVLRGGKPTSTPVKSESESGTFKARAGNIVFTPTRKGGRKAATSISATIVGDEIRASYVLQSGGSQQRVSLTLKRDASYWGPALMDE